MENYTPKILENRQKSNLIEMCVEAYKCDYCGKMMLPKLLAIFPKYIRLNQKAQMENAGIVYFYTETGDSEKICEICRDNGKIDFVCELCNQRKDSSKIQKSIGSPADYLCKDCYENKSAKEWEEIEEQLYERHRYDFE